MRLMRPMRRRLEVALLVGVSLVSLSSSAQDAEGDKEDKPATEQPATPSDELPPKETPRAQPPPSSTTPPALVPLQEKPAAEPTGWHTEVHGYFRAPVSLGISSRQSPDDMGGPNKTQISYGPNRVFDWNYYSFAYTRLQEQDWAELFVHEKKPHVDAAVGWMGYWYQGAGFRNPDAAWVPGMAYLTLDTDFKLSDEIKPNIALTMGAWWPKFGYFEKYDTYTLGRFRQIGQQAQLTVPFTSDVTVALIEGFGTARDGSYNFTINNISPLYAGQTNLDLMAWVNLQLVYQKILDVSLHANTEWTSDPSLNPDTMMMPKSYTAESDAHLSVAGAEMNLRIPQAGHLWLSPSYISVRNGWALGQGTEVMHSLGGFGFAQNYLALTNSPTDSMGSGSMLAFGFMYENTLSEVLGKTRGSMLPDVAVSLFGLYAGASLDLPTGTTLRSFNFLKNDKLKQFKYGADVTVQLADWVAFMLRGDIVNYDLDQNGYIFAAVTTRLQFASHFLSSERIYFQYTRYIYGDNIVLNANWPWTQSLVQGSSVIQQAAAYSGSKPDANVVKLQSEIAF
jgi:hypothetical protein